MQEMIQIQNVAPHEQTFSLPNVAFEKKKSFSFNKTNMFYAVKDTMLKTPWKVQKI